MSNARIGNLGYYDALRFGLVKGHVAANVQGKSTRLSTTRQTLCDVFGLTLTFPAAAGTLKLASTSANDTAAGTGARLVRVIGLNDSFEEVQENVTLNGQTAVETTGEFYRVNSILVLSAGTSAANEGLIYCAASTDTFTAGVPTTPYSVVAELMGQTRCGIYTTPANTKTLPVHILYSCGNTDEVECTIEVRPNGSTVWYRNLEIYASHGNSGYYETRSAAVVNAGTDVRIMAASAVTSGEMRVSVAATQKLYDRDARSITTY